jgi:hypothetical protein
LSPHEEEPMRGTVRTVEPLRLFIALITSVLLAAASTPLAASDQGLATWESKVALRAEEPAWVEEPLALCSVRLVEGGSEVAIVCRHDLGTEGEVALIRAGDGERSVAPFWSAPLASPFEATASLAAPALEALLTGELALRIESSASGVVASGGIGTPIFDSGFDEFSLCEWSNFPCPSDGNVCTDEVCSSTGVCSHPNNTASCPLPNATGGCIGGNCAVVVSCNSGFSNCDANQLNGCEQAHNTLSSTCASAPGLTFVGEKGGDEACGVGCTATSEVTFSTQTGLVERWYQARAAENSACTANLIHKVRLAVPAGVDWDLFLYDDNCNLIDSSIGGTGVDEEVGIASIDFGTGSDDSFLYRVEVRYFSGGSCDDWSLTFIGRNCN